MRKMVKEKQARHVALPRDANPDSAAIEKPFWRQSHVTSLRGLFLGDGVVAPRLLGGRLRPRRGLRACPERSRRDDMLKRLGWFDA